MYGFDPKPLFLYAYYTYRGFALRVFYIQYYECFVSRMKSRPSVSINKSCNVLTFMFLYTA